MPNQKISELTAIVTVDTSLDVLPIVDTSANTTKKISPTALKTALALDNVNNTSDANKPVSTAQQDALNAKVTGNTAIVAATKTKITYDAKGLVTAGNILDAADMPTGIDAANIGTGVVSSTEFGYLDGVTSAIQTQLNAKQATLVSATNIKTINSTSLLGSGDIAISANPSGVAGAIQFSNGSAFASDATNLFWDDTNNRLGIGTNTPSATGHFQGAGDQLWATNSGDIYTYLKLSANGGLVSMTFGDGNGTVNYLNNYAAGMWASNKFAFGPSLFTPSGQVHIKGSGSTSATTSLLVQNSAGTATMTARDDGKILIRDYIAGVGENAFLRLNNSNGFEGGYNEGSGGSFQAGGSTVNLNIGSTKILQGYSGGISIGKGAVNPVASAQLEVVSTTKGFLPPVMTTTQKNAIATPAAGLVVYDSTTNKLCCYNGSSWNDLF